MNYLPVYDFSSALALTPDERIRIAVERIRRHLESEGIQQYFDLRLIPNNGSSETEIQNLERTLGETLPDEYREFLHRWRYLAIDDCCKIWGLDWNGVSYGRQWVSDEHETGKKYLVFADYWHVADGDQLLFDLDEPERGVIAYLHECGPAFEPFAPSFSLAVWRIAHESD